MDRRALKFNSKRTETESETSSSTNGAYLQTQPLKDNSNIRIIKVTSEPTQNVSTNSVSNLKDYQQLQQSSFNINNTGNSNNNNNKGSERPLKCLETLAQKAGITFDEKYDFASPPHSESFVGKNCSPVAGSATPTITNRTIIMEKSQSPAQQLTTSTAVPLQISPEQLQQLQQLQLQHSSPFAIQVKQEFPTHTTTTGAHQLSGATGASGELKHASILDQSQLQQMQMQLAEAASGSAAPNSPANQQTPSSGAGAVATMQQHSATISTMSPMQITSAGQVSGDWSQGRTVQVMQQPTALNSGFLYHPQMLVSGNLFHSAGLTQQPIQVIAASKPFQGGAPQMITTTTQNAKQMLGGNTTFPTGTYAIPSSQSPQTFLFSPMNPVNVISPSPQQQNILQTMAAAAAANAQQQQQQQQQQNIAKANVNQEAQKNIQQKVVQKVTTTTNTVQSAAGGAASGNVTQQQQQHAQQCVQVSSQTGMPTTQIIGQIQGSTGAPQQMQITAPWLPVWPNGLQQLTQNPIIIRGPQADGTPGGMFIQQPTTATHQALQTTQQPNQITLQCNVTQPQAKQRSQLEAFVAKQQQAHQVQATQSQQSAVNQLAAQQQAVAVAAANAQLQQTAASQRASQLQPQNGTQLRPASSVSTQTAQNQTILKHKIRSKQQPVRPALPTMKTENGQQKAQTLSAAGLQQQLTAANSAAQHQQPTMHQVVTSAGNKMVVMSAGTPITIQNGQALQQATATTTHLDKHQQQQQIQLQQIQKQQLLQQQILQQQFAHIQIQQQQQQQQQQQHQPQQIQLQMAPATAQALLAQQQQQQQQQQLQNQILQQQQQQQQQLQQREQQQNIIHQIVVQQSPQQQHQQQNSLTNSLSQQQQHQLQQHITAVPVAVPSSTPAVVSAGGALQSQQVTYQAKSQTMPTTSVVTISNQTGPLVTSTVGVNQAAQLQQNFIAATIASQQQQQQQQSQISQSQHTTQSQLPTQNPILAMASMINAPSNVGNANLNPSTSSHNTSVTSSTTQPTVTLMSSISSSPQSSLTTTFTKTSAIEQHQVLQAKPGASTALGTSITTVDMGNRIPLSIASSNASTVVSATNVPSMSLSNELKETSFKLHQNTSTEQVLETASAKSSSSVSTAANSISSQNEMCSQNASNSTIVDITPAPSNSQQHSSPAKFSTAITATIQAQSPLSSPLKNSAASRNIIDVSKSSSTWENSEKSASSTPSNEEKQSTTTGSQTAIPTSASITKTTVSGTVVKVEKTDLPKAMIKPNVLTHVIDDFIIQEASEPFPVTRQRYADKDTTDEPPKKKSALDDISTHSLNSSITSDMIACENCGKAEHKAKLKKKRFCSLSCARQAKSSSNDQQMEAVGNNESNSVLSLHANANVGSTSASATAENMQVDSSPHSNGMTASSYGHQQLPANANLVNDCASTTNPTAGSAISGEQSQMMNWSVSEVCEFIKNLPGCSDYVDDFEQQEIDGQALLLLKENHLVNAMGMKLGPALKIVAKVESMKEVNVPTNSQNTEKEGTLQQ